MPLARVLHHGRCFDGAVSAALMVRLFRETTGEELSIETRPMAHGKGDPFDAASFDADLNAVVDFRYSADPRLTWWFDHHATAFLSDADRRHFEADTTGKKFFEPTAPSCAGFMQRVGQQVLGFDLSRGDAELIAWAEKIDAARFDSPQEAVALASPALQIMTWLEAAATNQTEARLIVELADGASLAELADRDYLRKELEPALARHRELCALVADEIRMDGGVAVVDLASRTVRGINKFIPYSVHPEADYTVMVLTLPGRTKVSVGSNPWAPERRRHDIGAICQRYGGGGHAVVGAVSRPRTAQAQVRQIAAEIIAELRR